jgi:hypothetical protein
MAAFDLALTPSPSWAGRFSSPMDSVYRVDPFRDQKPMFEHLRPLPLLLTVARHVGIQTALYLVEDEAKREPVPKDGKALANFMTKRVWKLFVKDISVVTLTRMYERAAIDRVLAAVPPGNTTERKLAMLEAGAYVRNPTKASSEASSASRTVRRSRRQSGVGAFLSSRAEASVHVAFHVIPQPSLILGLATLTVEEADVLATW